MPAAVVLSLFLSLTFQPAECADVKSCRQAAIDAQSRNDFEVFHDLAWRAVQKGSRNDPDLMLLLARAQSLSGRPGDALVMLRRLARMGVSVDVASEDFQRVRALPAWPEVAALFDGGKPGVAGEPPGPKATEPPAPTPAVEAPKRTAEKPVPPTPSKAGAAKEALPPAADAKPEPAREGAKSNAPGEEEALPDAIATIAPAGLAYDSVSRRFIVGDRQENKLVVFDDVFKRATNMVAAGSAGFFALTAIEIDPKRGDLWITNSAADRGASLHKLQLVSGRVLFEISVPAEFGPTTLVDAAVLGDGEVLVLDAEGKRILGVSPSSRSFKRAATVDVEGATSIASNGGSIAYVAHRKGLLRVDLAARKATAVRGAPAGLLRIRSNGHALVGVQLVEKRHRIVRLRLDAAGGKMSKLDVLDGNTSMPDAAAMTIAEGVLYYLTSVNGGAVLHRARLQK